MLLRAVRTCGDNKILLRLVISAYLYIYTDHIYTDMITLIKSLLHRHAVFLSRSAMNSVQGDAC
jgi:hypothetical protein